LEVYRHGEKELSMSVTVRPLSTAGMRAASQAHLPFAEEPTADMYYPGEAHEEALARMLYLVEERDRCGVLTGAAGTGKSTVMLRLHQQLRRSGWKSCRIDLAGVDHAALLHRLAAELGANPVSDANPHDLWDQLELILAAAARVQQPWVLLFDHADRLRPGALSLLEQLLHTPHSRGMVMLFATRNEGRTPLVKALSEHTSLRIELLALSVTETQRYIEHALDRGMTSTVEFTPEAVQSLARITNGVPRQINRLCRAVMLVTNAERRSQIDDELVLSIAEELLDYRSA
jgi:general secretion pathway protein A